MSYLTSRWSLGVLLLLFTGCQSSTDEAVEAGLALKADYQTAWCAVAADPACESAADTCVFSPYTSVADCESVVNLSFANCDGIYEALAEASSSVEACLDQLAAIECPDGLCDDQGNELLEDLDCAIIADLQSRLCRGPDTF